jgi:hypothetical protein
MYEFSVQRATFGKIDNFQSELDESTVHLISGIKSISITLPTANRITKAGEIKFLNYVSGLTLRD